MLSQIPLSAMSLAVVAAYAIYKVRHRSSAAAPGPAEPVDAEVDSELEPS